jgi:hypothetical protein
MMQICFLRNLRSLWNQTNRKKEAVCLANGLFFYSYQHLFCINLYKERLLMDGERDIEGCPEILYGSPAGTEKGRGAHI